jgi:hypothetical protein
MHPGAASYVVGASSELKQPGGSPNRLTIDGITSFYIREPIGMFDGSPWLERSTRWI